MRDRVVGLYGNITPDFVDQLANTLKGKKVLEVFGGNGYLANELHKRGIDIHCTSILSGMDGHEENLFFDVENITASDAVLRYGSDYDVLLMCWATVTNDADLALIFWGVNKDIVYIGERNQPELGKMGLAGCATDRVHELLKPVLNLDDYTPKNMLDTAFVGRIG
ncbi:hypothetical protein [Vibrio crassostreae]|uniref:hypothetical protein n=1 Tax=Vibrio crassostreae TaxID=246167 RepID=UPI001B3057C4|nr:hypothetical protein [Vibrio crassostreae]